LPRRSRRRAGSGSGQPRTSLRLIRPKPYCRDIATEAGVPVLPGSLGLVSNSDGAYLVAERIPCPLLLKLDRDGGGTGIETVRDANEVPKVFESVQRIGLTAFGASDVYVEMAVAEPRRSEELTAEQEQTLRMWTRAGTTEQRLARRARRSSCAARKACRSER